MVYGKLSNINAAIKKRYNLQKTSFRKKWTTIDQHENGKQWLINIYVSCFDCLLLPACLLVMLSLCLSQFGLFLSLSARGFSPYNIHFWKSLMMVINLLRFRICLFLPKLHIKNLFRSFRTIVIQLISIFIMFLIYSFSTVFITVYVKSRRQCTLPC